jgi:hypothetical protein
MNLLSDARQPAGERVFYTRPLRPGEAPAERSRKRVAATRLLVQAYSTVGK